jgi:hypothetical protein
MKTVSRRFVAVVTGVSITAALAVTGCSTTHQTRGAAEPSAFLGDTSQMREGKSGEAKLVYVSPQADFRTYDKILLDPVVLVAENAKASAFTSMSKDDQQAVVNYVDARIREKLGQDYTFVTAAGPGVMRLRVAVTEAQGSAVLLDTVSTIMPVGLAVSAVKRVAVGTHSSVGKAGVEMELLDAATGERLAAGVDERAGRKITLRFDKLFRYHTVEDAFDYWTTRLQQRLAALRAPAPASAR